jgi:hypothetical protein
MVEAPRVKDFATVTSKSKAPAAPPKQKSDLRVLIVEDNLGTASLLL